MKWFHITKLGTVSKCTFGGPKKCPSSKPEDHFTSRGKAEYEIPLRYGRSNSDDSGKISFQTPIGALIELIETHPYHEVYRNLNGIKRKLNRLTIRKELLANAMRIHGHDSQEQVSILLMDFLSEFARITDSSNRFIKYSFKDSSPGFYAEWLKKKTAFYQSPDVILLMKVRNYGEHFADLPIGYSYSHKSGSPEISTWYIPREELLKFEDNGVTPKVFKSLTGRLDFMPVVERVFENMMKLWKWTFTEATTKQRQQENKEYTDLVLRMESSHVVQNFRQFSQT